LRNRWSRSLAGKRLGHGFRGRAVDVRGDDAGPRLGEFLRIDFADPFAAAGDDDGAAGQIKALVHWVPLWIKRGALQARSMPSLLARSRFKQTAMSYHKPLPRAFGLDL
jgi:hypothetical protein